MRFQTAQGDRNAWFDHNPMITTVWFRDVTLSYLLEVPFALQKPSSPLYGARRISHLINLPWYLEDRSQDTRSLGCQSVLNMLMTSVRSLNAQHSSSEVISKLILQVSIVSEQHSHVHSTPRREDSYFPRTPQHVTFDFLSVPQVFAALCASTISSLGPRMDPIAHAKNLSTLFTIFRHKMTQKTRQNHSA